MAKNFSERLSEQLQTSPLVQETDNYMEKVLSEEPIPEVKPEKPTPVAVENPKREVVKEQEPKYPAPFVTDMPGSPKHCQALVDAATYANMQMLKNVGAVAPNMSFGAMATQALQEWVDRKIKEYVKKQRL